MEKESKWFASLRAVQYQEDGLWQVRSWVRADFPVVVPDVESLVGKVDKDTRKTLQETGKTAANVKECGMRIKVC